MLHVNYDRKLFEFLIVRRLVCPLSPAGGFFPSVFMYLKFYIFRFRTVNWTKHNLRHQLWSVKLWWPLFCDTFEQCSLLISWDYLIIELTSTSTGKFDMSSKCKPFRDLDVKKNKCKNTSTQFVNQTVNCYHRFYHGDFKFKAYYALCIIQTLTSIINKSINSFGILFCDVTKKH